MSHPSFWQRHKRVILLAIILILAVRVFIPQLDTFVESLQTLADANLAWVLLGIILYYTGVPVMAAQFVALAFKKLSYGLTLRVQGAALFVNKLLPQGVGTISLNIYYFIKKGHTPNQAAAALTMNAILSTSAYIVLIILALIFSDVSLNGIFEKQHSQDAAVSFGALLLIGGIITILTSKNIRGKITSVWTTFKKNLAAYKDRPKSVLTNAVLNGIGTSLNVLTLIVSAKALGIDISFADALIAYTFGNFAATLIPTPGGIGSAEMGIYSGLVIVGVDSASALSITLLYRLISYWLAILPGYLFFRGLKKTIFADYALGSGSNKSKKTDPATA